MIELRERRLDVVDEQTIEAILVVLGEAQRLVGRRVGEALVRLAHRHPRERRPRRRCVRPSTCTAAPGDARDELLGVAHDRVDPRVRAIELEDRELGVVALAELARAERARDLEDARVPVGEQALHLVLGRRAQEAAAPAPRCRSTSNASRWRSSPGEGMAIGVSTSR